MIIFIIALFLVVLIDQISKILVLHGIGADETHYLIKDFLYITKVYNKGAGWGIGSGSTWLLCLISLVASALMIYFVIQYKSLIIKNKMLAVAAGLIVGGTIGNLIDRFLTVIKSREGVVDFIGMWIGNYQWPVYNIADAALVVGIIIAFIALMINNDKEKSANEEEIHS